MKKEKKSKKTSQKEVWARKKKTTSLKEIVGADEISRCTEKYKTPPDEQENKDKTSE